MNVVLLLKLKIRLGEKKTKQTLKTLITICRFSLWQGEDAWCLSVFVLVLGCLVDCFYPKYFA